MLGAVGILPIKGKAETIGQAIVGTKAIHYSIRAPSGSFASLRMTHEGGWRAGDSRINWGRESER